MFACIFPPSKQYILSLDVSIPCVYTSMANAFLLLHTQTQLYPYCVSPHWCTYATSPAAPWQRSLTNVSPDMHSSPSLQTCSCPHTCTWAPFADIYEAQASAVCILEIPRNAQALVVLWPQSLTWLHLHICSDSKKYLFFWILLHTDVNTRFWSRVCAEVPGWKW